jgi:hypothetical protein
MSNEVKKAYLSSFQSRYQKASKSEKSRLLTDFCTLMEYCSRKHASRVLSGALPGRAKRPGAQPKYTVDLIKPLKALWIGMERMCSKRMVAAMPDWLPHYKKRHPELTPEQEAKLLKISAATIDRLLRPVRAKKGLSSTQAPAGTWYRSVIPIQPKDWNVTKPGHMQGDTVAHCGDSLHGAFANTLTLTDIHSEWTENRATWTKGSSGIIEAIRELEKSLPFTIYSMKFDSGSEFMNYGVINYLSQTTVRAKPIQIVRSRPYKKDDNCYVEQKNLTHVRNLIGYDRIDVPECVEILNEIYRDYWNPLQNFFFPAIKLQRKTRIGSKLKKEYDDPRSPYQRLLGCADISDEAKRRLRERHESLDPFELQEGLQKKLKLLFETLRKQRSLLRNAA